MMMVAKVAVALSPSAGEQVRANHLARARGDTALAAKPIGCGAKSRSKRAWPIGSSKYFHRRARTTNHRQHGDGADSPITTLAC